MEYKNRKNENKKKKESNENKPQILNILWSREIDETHLISQTEPNEDKFSSFYLNIMSKKLNKKINFN
jgi:hypothetical protein